MEDDVPWLVDLCRRRYSNKYDQQASELWFRNIVLKSPMVFLPIRTDNAFLIALISVTPWLPADNEAHVIMVCADTGHGLEAVTLLRESVAWARRRKCATWRIVSETDMDLGAFARRVGATEITPRYTLNL